MRIGLQGVVTGALGLTSTIVLAACGGIESEANGAEGTRADVASAAAEIVKYKTVLQFSPPGPTFDAVAKVRGKTIFQIPTTSEVPFITAVEERMQQAAELVGAKLVVYSNQGEPSQSAQGIESPAPPTGKKRSSGPATSASCSNQESPG